MEADLRVLPPEMLMEQLLVLKWVNSIYICRVIQRYIFICLNLLNGLSCHQVLSDPVRFVKFLKLRA